MTILRQPLICKYEYFQLKQFTIFFIVTQRKKQSINNRKQSDNILVLMNLTKNQLIQFEKQSNKFLFRNPIKITIDLNHKILNLKNTERQNHKNSTD